MTTTRQAVCDIEICNSMNQSLCSEILDTFHNIASNKNMQIYDAKYSTNEHTKSVSLYIYSFIVSVAAGVFVEILKYCVNKFKNREEFESTTISINGDVFYIKDVAHDNIEVEVENESNRLRVKLK